jgi:hypothetical protein
VRHDGVADADAHRGGLLALSGLAQLQSEKAKEILRETAESALRRETREQARQYLSQLEAERFAHPGGELSPDDSSPFKEADEESEAAKNTVVQLSLAPSLAIADASQVLAAVSAAQVAGVRLVSGDGERPAGELHLVPTEKERQQFPQSVFQMTLAPGGEAATAIRLQSSSNSKPLRAPSFEAVQFALEFQLAQQFNHHGAMFYDHGGPRQLGMGSLPIAITVECAAGLRSADLTRALAAVGATSAAEGAARNMIQWIRLEPAGQPPSLWFLTVPSAEPE